ncbi:S8 family serine peptidase [Streptomyces sp. NPDC006296]|uniref:S8 family serine peptidase n=1 Tax=Streptomyces sp. NPDC006296 TaxID=3156746 RepID=UPI0033A2A344
MKPPARGTARLLSGAGIAAALLLPAAVPAQAAPPLLPMADGEKGQELPAMPSSLDPGNEQLTCTPASREKAKKQDWSRQRLDLDRLHGHSTGEGTTVALVDTGAATGAAGLKGRVTAQGAAGEDCVGHGTFLAGLIAGDGGGNTRLAGVAPNAKVLALRGTDERGQADAALVTEAVKAATTARADVIAVAVALPRRDAALSRAVAAAREAGAVVVAAATPDPPRTGTDEIPARTYWPAGEPGVLSVGDMLPAGVRPDRALPTDGIDLVAPGAGVVSGGPRGDGHYLGAGASVATAYAAGAAAAVHAAYPGEAPDDVARRLTATAYPADIPQLDPYAAVTTVLGEPGSAPGAGRAAEPVTVRDTASADRATGRATLFVLLGSASVLAVLWAGFAFTRARARGWRPAGAAATGPAPAAMPE